MTLWELNKCADALITDLDPDLDSAVKIRLTEMGFERNQTVKCLRHSPFSGPIVIQLGDCVYTLEQQIAQQIFISTL
jgi:ferrous iron transport protein A